LIKIAQNKLEAKSLCHEFFNIKIGKFQVEAILIEELVQIQHEYYCGVTLDTSGRQFYIIGSKEGGVDIEEVAATHPEAIIKESFTLTKGLSIDLAKKVAIKLGFSDKILDSVVNLFLKLWEIVLNTEALLVEINPLILTKSGLVAIDAKMILDDNAAERNPITKELLEKRLSPLDRLAKDAGFSFVELEGDIGILANGAGLTMALLDILSQSELKPANFLDVGGGANKERIYKALELIFKLKPKCIFINIFGGITRCDVVAEAIIQSLKDFKDTPPMIIRLTGTKEKEGISLLKNAGIDAFPDALQAVDKIKTLLSSF
jgi:succinyl-CoA synthetase beta subunit